MAKPIKDKWKTDRAYPRYVKALMDMKAFDTQADAVIGHIDRHQEFEAYDVEKLERIRDVAQQVLDAVEKIGDQEDTS